MERIKLNDTGLSAAMKMSEGNPGAVIVCAMMLKQGKEIDPDDFMEGLGNLLGMDTLGIYGSRIWMLFKDVCGEDLRVTCAVLRAKQLGYVTAAKLNYAIDHRGEGIDVPMLVALVEDRLPNFQRAPEKMNSHVAFVLSQSAEEAK